MGKIVAFPDGKIINTGSPKDLVKFCKDLLKEAESGDLQAVAIACVYENDDIYTSWSVDEERWGQLLGAMIRLNKKIEDEECANG